MSASAPALRQPKSLNKIQNQKPPSNLIITDCQNVILTLKDCRKLVISSDSYHGIIMAGNMYKCVFCRTDIELNSKCKEDHMSMQKHLKCMEQHPHLEEFSENLLRKLSHNEMYCSICNVVVTSQFLARHVCSDTHKELLQKAEMKATTYKPY